MDSRTVKLWVQCLFCGENATVHCTPASGDWNGMVWAWCTLCGTEDLRPAEEVFRPSVAMAAERGG